MTQALPPTAAETLQSLIALAEDVANHGQAHAEFEALYDQVRHSHPELADLLKSLWQAYVAAQRSSAFWKELSEVEKKLADRMTESHLQLRQNYLRLMQEQ